MKHIAYIILMWAMPLITLAQAPTEGARANATTTITQHLRQSGRVVLRQDNRLESLLTREQKTYSAASRVQLNKQGKQMISVSGYRVRVFSGNNQITSKNEAYKIEKELLDYMPELSTYVIFRTPNWRLMVGNYRTMEEATAALRELKKKFPVYGREMFVVKDEIEIPLNN